MFANLGSRFKVIEDANGKFSPGNTDGHTWTGLVLPHIEQTNVGTLYERTVSWDHDDNQEAITTVIPTFICPSNPNTIRLDDLGSGKFAAVLDYAAMTSVAKVVYDSGFAESVKNMKGGLAGSKGSEIRDILDELSDTIMLAEDAGRPVHHVSSGGVPRILTWIVGTRMFREDAFVALVGPIKTAGFPFMDSRQTV